MKTSSWTTKAGLAPILKGGVIMDVVTPDQARLAEAANACAVVALERVPADIRAPVIDLIGPGVALLARLEDGRSVAAQQEQFLAMAFHPELTDDLAFHRQFFAVESMESVLEQWPATRAMTWAPMKGRSRGAATVNGHSQGARD